MPFSTDNLRSPAALARFLLTTIVGLSLDLWTKHEAFLRLAAGPPYQDLGRDGQNHWFVNSNPNLIASDGYHIVGGWLHLKVTVNEGAVFGFGQGWRWVFLAISVAAILFLTYLFTTSGRQRFYQFILGLMLAGVLGNMYDRFRFGYVRDMIYGLPRWPHLFPWIFNVADVMLCVGVGLIFIYSLFHMRTAAKASGSVVPPMPSTAEGKT
jgi:signal peptidase II